MDREKAVRKGTARIGGRSSGGRRGWKRRGVAAVAGTVAAVTALLCLSPPLSGRATGSSSMTSESIREKEGEVSRLQDEKDALAGQISALQQKRRDLQDLKADLNEYVRQLDATLSEIQFHLEDLNDQIQIKELDIEATQEELVRATHREEEQYESMIARMRLMYERGSEQSLDLLLQAKSLREMLTQADYIERIFAFDKRMWEEYKETRAYVEVVEQQLELEKQILDEAKAAAEEEEAAMEQLIEEKTQEIRNYETQIASSEADIAAYEAERKAAENEIAALEAAIAEERKRLLEQSGQLRTYNGGAFCLPIKSYTRVSSPFGYRTDPITGGQRFHSGIDLAAPAGTPIYAAYDGTVAAATYNASMGNYVMIDHGDSLYTIYMHASALYVSKGDVVARGETIAAVGTTGRSTGNHLHFTVRLNGEYQEPTNWIPL